MVNDNYATYLAKQQHARFMEFCDTHPENNRQDNRLTFFGQRYEIQISFSITQMLALGNEYSEDHPVTP